MELGISSVCFLNNMTLPNLNKPDSDDTVRSIVSGIMDNINYLDTTGVGAKYKIVSFTRDATAADNTETITGVGFPAGFIVLFAELASGNGISFGTHGVSDGHVNQCIYRTETSTIGTPPTWGDMGRGFGNYSVIVYDEADDTHTNYVSASILGTNSDGFTITYTKNTYTDDNGLDVQGTPTGTINIIAFCIR